MNSALQKCQDYKRQNDSKKIKDHRLEVTKKTLQLNLMCGPGIEMGHWILE